MKETGGEGEGERRAKKRGKKGGRKKGERGGGELDFFHSAQGEDGEVKEGGHLWGLSASEAPRWIL